MKPKQPTHLLRKPLKLELVRASKLNSTIVLDQTYGPCLPDFETLTTGHDGRFTSQLGRCRLTTRSQGGFARITLQRGSTPLGEARLFWAKDYLNDLRVSVALRGHLLTKLNLPCLVVTLADKFEAKASPTEINLAFHTLVASAFGILRHRAKKNARVKLDTAVWLPTSDLVAELMRQKETKGIELFDLASHLSNLYPATISAVPQR